MKNLLVGLSLLASISSFACYNDYICKDDRVSSKNHLGTVVDVAGDRIKVKIDEIPDSFMVTDASHLSKKSESNCYRGFCEGNRVSTVNHSGTIVEVFDNGKTKVAIDEVPGAFIYLNVSQLNK